jgi:Ca-activated chloride channel family protein
MRYRYTLFDPNHYSRNRIDQLKELFLRILMNNGGDVDDALEWLNTLAERHGLWPEGMDINQFSEWLQEKGYISAESPRGKGTHDKARGMRYRPTRKAEKAIRTDAFDELFSQLRRDTISGDHVTPYNGSGGDQLPETRSWTWGDSVQDMDCPGSISNAIRNHGWNLQDMTEEDLQVHEVEHATSCATVLALDISHSMTLYGEDRITPAKKVALALTELIQNRYRKDALDVILFGDDAVIVEPGELAFVSNGPYHTNTQAALQLAQRILARKKHANKQVVMITDGKPSAIREGGQLYINSFGLDAKIVNKTIEEAQACRRKHITITTFMITSDPYLKQFVERLSRANKGRAYYADLKNLGKFVMMDYVRNRKQDYP